MELLAGQEVARRAGVEQRRQGGRGVDDDRWPARPASKSATIMAVPRPGREENRAVPGCPLDATPRRAPSPPPLLLKSRPAAPAAPAAVRLRRARPAGTRSPCRRGAKTLPGPPGLTPGTGTGRPHGTGRAPDGAHDSSFRSTGRRDGSSDGRRREPWLARKPVATSTLRTPPRVRAATAAATTGLWTTPSVNTSRGRPT